MGQAGDGVISATFDELRSQLAQVVTDLLHLAESNPDPDGSYAQATQLREDLQAASDAATRLRVLAVARIKDTFGLSIAQVGQRIGVTKARAQDMLEKAAQDPGTRAPRLTSIPPRADAPLMVRRTRRIPARGQGSGSSFAEEMRKLGHEPSTRLVQVAEVPAPGRVADALGIVSGEAALIRKRQMYADDQPVQLASSYIPLSVAGGTELAFPDTGPTGIYERLAARGHTVVRFSEDIEDRRPTAEEAQFLGITPGRTVLEVTRTAYDRVGRPLEVVVNVFPAGQWRLSYEWSAGDE